MPNWCENSLSVHGEKFPLQEFAHAATSEENFSFEALYPEPEGLDNEAAHQWRVEHWGTQGEPSDCSLEIQNAVNEDLHEITVNFDTAWSPPLAWVEQASAQFPELQFQLSWDEAGMDFSGEAVVQNGKVVSLIEGTSQSSVECASPDCDETDWVEIEDRSPDLVWWCPEHELEKQVLAATG